MKNEQCANYKREFIRPRGSMRNVEIEFCAAKGYKMPNCTGWKEDCPVIELFIPRKGVK